MTFRGTPTRNALVVAATLGVVLSSAVTARADNRIQDVTTGFADEHFEVRVSAEEALGSARVRSTEGFVRVWFPGLGSASIDTDGDGRAIRWVRIRPGYGDTNVAIIRIGDARTVPESAIRISMSETSAVIRIDRSALPHLPIQGEAIAAADEVAPELEAPVSPELAEPDDSAANEPPRVEEEPPAPADESDEEAVFRDSEPLAAGPIPTRDAASPMWVLTILTMLLGVAYLAVRWFQKRRGLPVGPNIQVVAQKRIGARHQLMVVRALGEDHLLAVHAGRTERIASSPAFVDQDADYSDSDGERDLLPFLRLGGGDESDSGPPDGQLHRKRRVDSRPRFGAELMKLVGERGRADTVSIGRAPASEAVSGLLRLREKLGR